MTRSALKRPMFSWLWRYLGPPPPPPKRHFSRSWNYEAQHGAVPGRAGRHRGTGPARRLASDGRAALNQRKYLFHKSVIWL